MTHWRSIFTRETDQYDLVVHLQVFLLLPSSSPVFASILASGPRQSQQEGLPPLSSSLSASGNQLSEPTSCRSGAGCLQWMWASVLPRTRGSKIEVFPVCIEGERHKEEGGSAMGDAGPLIPEALVISHCDLSHPLGRLLLLNLRGPETIGASSDSSSSSSNSTSTNCNSGSGSARHASNTGLDGSLPSQSAKRSHRRPSAVGGPHAVGGSTELSQSGVVSESGPGTGLGPASYPRLASDLTPPSITSQFTSELRSLSSIPSALISPPVLLDPATGPRHHIGSDSSTTCRRIVQVQAEGRWVLTVEQELEEVEVYAMQMAMAASERGMAAAVSDTTVESGSRSGFRSSEEEEQRGTWGEAMSSLEAVPSSGTVKYWIHLHEFESPLGSSRGKVQGPSLARVASAVVSFESPFVHLSRVQWLRPSPVASPPGGDAGDTGQAPQNDLGLRQGRLSDGTHTVLLVYGSLGSTTQSRIIKLQPSYADSQAVASPPPNFDHPPLKSSKTAAIEAGLRNHGDLVNVRVWARASDGTPVPISLVYSRQARLADDSPSSSSDAACLLPRNSPVLLQVYGAFGAPDNLEFQPGR